MEIIDHCIFFLLYDSIDIRVSSVKFYYPSIYGNIFQWNLEFSYQKCDFWMAAQHSKGPDHI